MELNRAEKFLIESLISERIAKLENQKERIATKDFYQPYIGLSIPSKKKIEEINKEMNILIGLLKKIKKMKEVV